MRKLVVGSFMTLDGVVQAPGAPNEDQEGGFAHGGWTVPLFDDELGQRMVALTDRADALLLGRKTYEGFAASWPLVGDEDPIAAKLNRIPKYVVSRTLTTAEWANTTILSGDVAKEVAELREQPGGEIHVSGSGTLVQTLLRHDLVDEFVLVVFPVLVGPGKRLFAEGTAPATLELVETSATGTGVVISTYRRRGPLEVGAMGPEQEGNA
ncbi:dihydrofolate reductase [Pseudonocardia hierapolitana]|uniref:Dihydrofolate reductase n=1 Tax=Pseudonocardia hierapolitana TaxID=1128676 RepID=A0A561SVK3_9PSEU|nr:dihydrofolate reductase family protein [Pseudonocardia hierapolitana]TWF78894.1 dihydrofolate reductase [Pseudonocardia hierapolitana]